MARSKQEMKKWARGHIQGVENTLFPSFTPDMKDLDEDAVRWDVRQSIQHGFFSTMCAAETGLTVPEAKRFVEIAAQEAGDKILVTTSLLMDTFEDNMELMEHAEKSGVHGVLLGYPPSFHPQDQEEIYTVTRRLCENTRMHVTLYPSPHFNFSRFHPSGFPLDVLVRLADLPNVVAIKAGEPGLFADIHRLVGDRVLVGCPVERFVPLLVQGFGMQWMGAGCYEVFQSPEKPYLVEYFNLLLEGKTDAGMEIYWKLTPARVIFEQQFNQTVMSGTYNWHQQKYYQWCVGGNGGLTRQPSMKVHEWEMNATKMAFYAIDITPREPDEEFFMGRMNYARMKANTAELKAPLESIRLEAASTVTGDPVEQAVALSRQLQAVLVRTKDELDRIPVMIRPMAIHAFKEKAGQNVQDWLKEAERLTQQLQSLAAANGDARLQFRSGLESLRGSLTRLAGYYQEAPAEAARFSRDPQALEQMKHQMAEWESVVQSLISAISRI